MAKINMGRVILGGLLAGLVLNIGEFLLNEPILGKQWAAAMEALNLPPIGGSAIGLVCGYVLCFGYCYCLALCSYPSKIRCGP